MTNDQEYVISIGRPCAPNLQRPLLWTRIATRYSLADAEWQAAQLATTYANNLDALEVTALIPDPKHGEWYAELRNQDRSLDCAAIRIAKAG